MHWNRRIAMALLGAFVLGCAQVGESGADETEETEDKGEEHGV